MRHSMGMASIKMYDKFGHILRIETTVKDVSFFKHYREVEQRHGEAVMKFAPMQKTIYSLGALREVLVAANRRYLEFLSAIDDPSDGANKLNKISRTVHEEARSYRGFNFFDTAYKINHYARISRNTTAARCRGFCAGFTSTACSRKCGTATSTTSPRPPAERNSAHFGKNLTT